MYGFIPPADQFGSFPGGFQIVDLKIVFEFASLSGIVRDVQLNYWIKFGVFIGYTYYLLFLDRKLMVPEKTNHIRVKLKTTPIHTYGIKSLRTSAHF